MASVSCQEISGLNCPTSISGSDYQDFRHNAYEHGRKSHQAVLRKMSRDDQINMDRRLQELWNSKSAVHAR